MFSRTSDILTETAPAKVNLYLHVVGRRPDGYHLLDSLVAFAGVGDRLFVEPAEKLSLRVTGPFASQLVGEADNLVLRAARALAELCGVAARGALTLEKNLPVASGIGGGSADAAAALRLLCRFWSVDPGATALAQLAQPIGADVPVCLLGHPAIMSGIGEILAPVAKFPRLGIMLVNPRVPLSTAAVFRTRCNPFSEPLTGLSAGWPTSDALVTDLHRASNDLEAPATALAPEIGRVLTCIQEMPECLLGRMSGSGATCFGLFPTEQQAADAAAQIGRSGWWTWGGGFCHP